MFGRWVGYIMRGIGGKGKGGGRGIYISRFCRGFGGSGVEGNGVEGRGRGTKANKREKTRAERDDRAPRKTKNERKRKKIKGERTTITNPTRRAAAVHF